MMYKPKQDTVLVLDLDDTLYKEVDYVFSGIDYIADLLRNTKKIDIKERLVDFHKENPKGDFLAYSCHLAGLPLSTKESLLWAYRTHYPAISLESGTRKWLEECEQEYHAIAILTDGRAITQRLKIAALDLAHIPTYISEEWDSVKPDQKRFLAIQRRWPDMQYIYIGDNLKKDFIGPNGLGWTTFCLKSSGANLHSQDVCYDLETGSPCFFINNFTEINEIYIRRDSR